MREFVGAFLGLACGVGLAAAAAAQTDFTTASKIDCVVVSATLCVEPGKCTTSLASDSDKRIVFTMDFTAKKASLTNVRVGGDIVEDKIVGGVRHIVMAPIDKDTRVRMTLTKDGKLAVDPGNGQTAVYTCTAAR